jgi:hypothetical protein
MKKSDREMIDGKALRKMISELNGGDNSGESQNYKKSR